MSNSDLSRHIRPAVEAASRSRRGLGWTYDNLRERYLREHGAKYGAAFDRDFAKIAAEGRWYGLTTTFSLPRAVRTRRAERSDVLDEVRATLERYVAYPNDWASTAHTLWCAHAWVAESFDATPRLGFLSPEPGSGKTRALELTEVLTPDAVIVVNSSTSAVFRSIGAEASLPTLLFDEVDTIFAGKSESSEELRGILNSGYRRGAYVMRTVMMKQGKKYAAVVEKHPTFAPVALAGLNRLPDTLASRTIVINMKKRAPGVVVEPWRVRQCKPAVEVLAGRLDSVMKSIGGDAGDATPAMPVGVEDRDADVWEPLIAIADLVGGDWPERARTAAVAAVAERRGGRPSLGVQLLIDVRTAFGSDDNILSANLLGRLHSMETAPWSDLKGKPIDGRFLASTLREYGVAPPRTVRTGTSRGNGYTRDMIHDAWSRYCPQPVTFALKGADHEV